MPTDQDSMTRLVTKMVPSLSKSLAEQFNVFQVMHHGTHEKQLSNVFAWLLSVDGTHELGDAFQSIFIECLNNKLPAAEQVPAAAYRVTQEANTSQEAEGKDIADIVLTNRTASVVIENFGTSDGHGHNYHGYLAHGAVGGRQSVVVLLCIRHEPHLQTDGWQEASVLTYAELLSKLQTYVEQNHEWSKHHPQQQFFLSQLIDNFLEGPRAVNHADHLSFIKTMCETGEAARYGYAKQDVAAQEFAEQLARHAQHQFEEGRKTLLRVKRALASYVKHTLVGQLKSLSTPIDVDGVNMHFRGQWAWMLELTPISPLKPGIFIVFGPTITAYLDGSTEDLPAPDYSRIFVKSSAAGIGSTHQLVQTVVGLDEVLDGLSSDDLRLRDAIVKLVAS